VNLEKTYFIRSGSGGSLCTSGYSNIFLISRAHFLEDKKTISPEIVLNEVAAVKVLGAPVVLGLVTKKT
jgi:hypothetical protein